MALPLDTGVPTTDRTESIGVTDSSVDALDPRDVPSGRELAGLSLEATEQFVRGSRAKEIEGALAGNVLIYNQLVTRYGEEQAVLMADRVSTLDESGIRELEKGNMEPILSGPGQTADPEKDPLTGPALAAYATMRAQQGAVFQDAETQELGKMGSGFTEVAQQREADRAEGREPGAGVDANSPDVDLEPARETGQAPSGGLGGFMQSMNQAAQARAEGSQQQQKNDIIESLNAKAVSMQPSL